MMTDSLKTVTDTLVYNPKLGNLEPILMPEPVPFEPVTIGWYIVFGMVIVILLVAAYRLFKKYQQNAYRRRSVKKLLELRSEINKVHPSQLTETISTILKATALKSYPRQKVAKLSGKDWQNFLLSAVPSGSKKPTVFALLDYQYLPETENGTAKNSDFEELIDVSVQWIRRHHV